jgi:hypothetical protein
MKSCGVIVIALVLTLPELARGEDARCVQVREGVAKYGQAVAASETGDHYEVTADGDIFGHITWSFSSPWRSKPDRGPRGDC